MNKSKKMTLTARILTGFILGIALGLIFGERTRAIGVLGDIFISLVQMTMVPLIFFTITAGVCSLTDMRELRRIGLKTLAFYVACTFLCCTLGLLLANLIQPGLGFDASALDAAAVTEAASLDLSDTVLSFFPSNIVRTMANGDMFPLIVFCMFLSIGTTMLGEAGAPLRKFFSLGMDVMLKVIDLVMLYAPVGICALMAVSVGSFGVSLLGSLLKYLLVCYIGFLVIFLLYALMIKLIAKLPVGQFVKKAAPIFLMAASTTSSSSTLPVNLEVTEKELGVDKKISNFALPLGATINMNGVVVVLATTVVFVAGAYGIRLSFADQARMVLMASLIAMGAPGLPGGLIVDNTILLTTMGLPLNLMGVLAGIDRIYDVVATPVNVLGDTVTAACVAASENLLDRTKYRPRAGK